MNRIYQKLMMHNDGEKEEKKNRNNNNSETHLYFKDRKRQEVRKQKEIKQEAWLCITFWSFKVLKFGHQKWRKFRIKSETRMTAIVFRNNIQTQISI